MFRVALVGSTGGGSATLSNGIQIVDGIERHLQAITNKNRVGDGECIVRLDTVILIACHTGMDFATSTSVVELWLRNESTSGALVRSPSVRTLHQAHHQMDPHMHTLTQTIDQYDALISISSDPDGSNKQLFQAAAQCGIPIVGTGGTSISTISTIGGNVIGCSGGSVATTSATRGICFASSIAAHLGLTYRLPHPPKWAKFRSVVGAALPLLLAVSLLKQSFPLVRWLVDSVLVMVGAGSGADGGSGSGSGAYSSGNCSNIDRYNSSGIGNGTGSVFDGTLSNQPTPVQLSVTAWLNQLETSVETNVLPVIIAAIACTEVSGLQELSMLTGAGELSVR